MLSLESKRFPGLFAVWDDLKFQNRDSAFFCRACPLAARQRLQIGMFGDSAFAILRRGLGRRTPTRREHRGPAGE